VLATFRRFRAIRPGRMGPDLEPGAGHALPNDVQSAPRQARQARCRRDARAHQRRRRL